MRPLSRRRALQLGGLGVAGVVVGSAGLAWAGTTHYDPVAGETLTAPAVLTSTAGNLTLPLEAAAGRGTLAGRDATMLRYNGSVPGPTLHRPRRPPSTTGMNEPDPEPSSLPYPGIPADTRVIDAKLGTWLAPAVALVVFAVSEGQRHRSTTAATTNRGRQSPGPDVCLSFHGPGCRALW